METTRLRTIQQPSLLERLLHAFIVESNSFPEEAYQVRNRSDLPSSLQKVIIQAGKQGQVWECWAYATNIWLFVAEMSLALSRERGSPVLQLNVYREDGRLKDSATWVTDRTSRWRRCID